MCASCAPAADSARPRGAACEGFAHNRQIRSLVLCIDLVGSRRI
jgi:hypothetical protein